MKVGSLFSGVEGFGLGFKQAGMSVEWVCEFDKYASQVLAERFPDTPNHKDVRDVYTKTTPSPVDLICGGFPCQDVSVAGKRKGLAGEWSGLWFEFARIIEAARPRWVVIENVPGLLSSNEGRDFATILFRLAEFGYGVSYRVLNSQYFGVPQRRRRVFIVASLGSGRCAEVLFEQESHPGNSKTRPEKQHSDPRLVGTLSASGAGVSRPAGQRNELDFLIPDDYVAGTLSGDIWHTSKGAEFNQLAPSFTTGYEGDRIVQPNEKTVGTIKGSQGGAGQGMDIVAVKEDYSGHLTKSEVSPSLQEGKRGIKEGAIIQDRRLRRLTPSECERLQGFPDNWTDVDGMSDTQRYKMMGNAVTVNVAKWIGQRIMQADNQ